MERHRHCNHRDEGRRRRLSDEAAQYGRAVDRRRTRARSNPAAPRGRCSEQPNSRFGTLRQHRRFVSADAGGLSEARSDWPSRATVLLTGDVGTGKELVAAAIHHRSPRAVGPFVRVHCGALAEGLLESELFGHEPCSFTGAARQRQGRFEQAHGGTLLLDEVGEISLATQVKLLRVLQEREFERVGGNETIGVDVRVIAATHRDLRQMVNAGTFREDLFYRLNVINLHLPSLRERASDIPLLLSHFLKKFALADGKPALALSSATLQLLTSYPWPGNVREVENVMQGAVVLADGELVEPRHLPPEITSFVMHNEGLPAIPGASMLDFERYAILKTLEATGGSTSKTARLLGISVRKIQYRLQAYREAQRPDGDRRHLP
ncbi:MAG: sigma 54-interacting transcriptional regulator [Pseudomonadota bacterium]